MPGGTFALVEMCEESELSELSQVGEQHPRQNGYASVEMTKGGVMMAWNGRTRCSVSPKRNACLEFRGATSKLLLLDDLGERGLDS